MHLTIHKCNANGMLQYIPNRISVVSRSSNSSISSTKEWRICTNPFAVVKALISDSLVMLFIEVSRRTQSQMGLQLERKHLSCYFWERKNGTIMGTMAAPVFLSFRLLSTIRSRHHFIIIAGTRFSVNGSHFIYQKCIRKHEIVEIKGHVEKNN